MNGNEYMDIAGKLYLRKYTPDNQLIEEKLAHNQITYAGRDLVARLFNLDNSGGDIKRVSEIRVGISDTPFDAAATGLSDEVGMVPVNSVTSVDTTDGQGRKRVTLQIVGELTEDDVNGQALKEAGLFTSDGIMYNRVTFDTITKSNQFKLTLFWEITF